MSPNFGQDLFSLFMATVFPYKLICVYKKSCRNLGKNCINYIYVNLGKFDIFIMLSLLNP